MKVLKKELIKEINIVGWFSSMAFIATILMITEKFIHFNSEIRDIKLQIAEQTQSEITAKYNLEYENRNYIVKSSPVVEEGKVEYYCFDKMHKTSNWVQEECIAVFD